MVRAALAEAAKKRGTSRGGAAARGLPRFVGEAATLGIHGSGQRVRGSTGRDIRAILDSGAQRL
eukprot:11159475-Lingulodinium_polyedra.AAC.1